MRPMLLVLLFASPANAVCTTGDDYNLVLLERIAGEGDLDAQRDAVAWVAVSPWARDASSQGSLVLAFPGREPVVLDVAP